MADSFTAIATEKVRASLDREQIERTPLRLTLTMTVGEWREIIGVLGAVTPTNASMRLYRTLTEAIEHFDRTFEHACQMYEGEG